MPETDELLTTEEAARFLKMHRDSIRRLIRSGKIPALLIGGEYRIRRADLDAMTAPKGGRKRAISENLDRPLADETESE